MRELPIHFKLRWLDDQGNETGFFSSKRGSFDGQTLVLDDVELSVANIISMEAYDERLAVAFVAGGMADSAAFRVYKVPAADLTRLTQLTRPTQVTRVTQVTQLIQVPGLTRSLIGYTFPRETV